jgi:hypothetical protein
MSEKRRYVIWSHEHVAWWKPNRSGYTPVLEDAGRYTMEEAADITFGVIPVGSDIAMLALYAKHYKGCNECTKRASL